MIEILGRDLTLEQLKGLVKTQENGGVLNIPKDWVLELVKSVENLELEVEKYKNEINEL